MKKIHRITMDELARQAGVSKATVSLILNQVPTARFAPETRERVLRLARELAFQPPPAARDKHGLIGMLLSRHIRDFFGDPYYLALYEGVSARLEPEPFLLTFLAHDPKLAASGELPSVVEKVYQRPVDGLLVMGTTPVELLAPLRRAVPNLVLVNYAAEEDLDAVWFDNARALRQALEALIALGHRRVALLLPESEGANYVLRAQAFQRAGEERRDLALELFRCRDNSREAARAATLAALPRLTAKGFTALLGGDDQLALGALQAAREIGIEVPARLSIAGIDDIPEAAAAPLPLSTVRIPAREMGLAAAEQLLELIRSPGRPSRKTLFGTTWVPRASTAPAS